MPGWSRDERLGNWFWKVGETRPKAPARILPGGTPEYRISLPGRPPVSANLIKASARRMYFPSRRDSTIAAWQEVPGKRSSKEPSRRYGMIRRNKATPKLQSPNRSAHTFKNQTVPYGTVSWGWRCSRHFVPGYDRTVPPGQKPLASRDPRIK